MMTTFDFSSDNNDIISGGGGLEQGAAANRSFEQLMSRESRERERLGEEIENLEKRAIRLNKPKSNYHL